MLASENRAVSSDPTLRDLRQLLYTKTGDEFTDEQLQDFEGLLGADWDAARWTAAVSALYNDPDTTPIADLVMDIHNDVWLRRPTPGRDS